MKYHKCEYTNGYCKCNDEFYYFENKININKT